MFVKVLVYVHKAIIKICWILFASFGKHHLSHASYKFLAFFFLFYFSFVYIQHTEVSRIIIVDVSLHTHNHTYILLIIIIQHKNTIKTCVWIGAQWTFLLSCFLHSITCSGSTHSWDQHLSFYDADKFYFVYSHLLRLPG